MSTQELVSGMFDAGAPSDEELGSTTVDAAQVVAPGGDTVIIKSLPGPDSPLVFKIIPQKRASGKSEGYWAITKHTHLVGDRDPKNKKNYRGHLCQKTAGQADCPECDKYYALTGEMKALEKAGKKGTPEYLRLETQSKVIQPSYKGWMLVVLPDSPKVKAICVSKDVINKLFGKAATSFKPAVESLINKMVANGNDPYNLKSQTGWIRAWKEGEGMGTTYTVEEAKQTVQVPIEGNMVTATVPAKFSVHENIFKTKRSELPNLGKFEERNVWKKEDSAFMATNFRAPDHVLAAGQGQSEEDDNPLSVGAEVPVTTALPTMPEEAKVAAATNPAVSPEAIDQML